MKTKFRIWQNAYVLILSLSFFPLIIALIIIDIESSILNKVYVPIYISLTSIPLLSLFAFIKKIESRKDNEFTIQYIKEAINSDAQVIESKYMIKKLKNQIIITEVYDLDSLSLPEKGVLIKNDSSNSSILIKFLNRRYNENEIVIFKLNTKELIFFYYDPGTTLNFKVTMDKKYYKAVKYYE